MRNIIGFLVAIATAALAIFGYGYYNAKAENKTEATIENLSADNAQVEEVPVW